MNIEECIARLSAPGCDIKWMEIPADPIPTHAQIQRLAEALKTNSSVEVLNLSDVQIGAKGAAALGEALSKNTTLKDLSLDDNQIGPSGAAALGEALSKNTSLELLWLCHNQISEKGGVALGDALVKNTTLLRLSLKDNPIEKQAKQTLNARLKCNQNIQWHFSWEVSQIKATYSGCLMAFMLMSQCRLNTQVARLPMQMLFAIWEHLFCGIFPNEKQDFNPAFFHHAISLQKM